MDFGSLLQTAKENDQSKKEVRYYSTKFAPPKKEEKKTANLSANIQKFLARKEAEEKRKQEDAVRKRNDLLALRSKDKKATRRVNVMLKRTKSANQSVIEDAVDNDNTAVTLAGPSQPDEDDYGYVSQEASAFYNKMMEKYNKMPDDPKFPLAKRKASNNLSNTKDRVKAALDREQEEALLPHRRKRKAKEDVEEKDSEVREKLDENKNEPPVKKKPKTAPPAMNFDELLKLAAVKQHEPIMIEVKPKEEEGPLLTKKQKKELEREQQRKEAKNQQATGKVHPRPQTDKEKKIPTQSVQVNGKLPTRPPPKPSKVPPVNHLPAKTKVPTSAARPAYPPREPQPPKPTHSPKPTQPPKSTQPPRPLSNRNDVPKKYSHMNSRVSVTKAVQPKAVGNGDLARSQQQNRESLPNLKSKPTSNPIKKAVPPPQTRPKQFPPPDVRQREPSPKQKLLMKRRIIDDDEEYDSEMDDFIDDGPEEMHDYSTYIKDIFGYDKNKYRDVDDDVDNMESSFAQQMREDVRSTKLGIMEDLEDIKREREEKKRKEMRKKGKL